MRSPPAGLRPVVSVSKTISRTVESIRPRRFRDKRESSRTWLSVVDRSPPVSITKSARRALLLVGHLARRGSTSSLASVIPGRASTRSRCASAGADTTMTLSNASSPCGLEQQGDVEQQRRLVAGWRAGSARARRAPPGWTIASSAASSSGWPSTCAASASRSSTPSLTVSAKALADRLRSARDPRPAAGAPPRRRRTPARRHARTSSATVDLPMPIEPVSASRIMRRAGRARAARRAAAAAACRGS